ncbi:MAG: cobalt transporter CbiM [Treponema sp.]|jgi:cobalt/nickel transport system permease protein|nr:cobalt transporter CbiM [Treponema sp.]
MHISEGVLTVPVLALGWGTAAAGIGFGLKKTSPENLHKTALVSGVLFLVSLVHVPLGPSSIHLTCLGLAGMLLGWSAVPALFVALVLQGVLFQFGGLLSLGVNTAIMGTAALTGYGIWRCGSGKVPYLFAFAGGFFAILIGSVLVTLTLALSNQDLILTAGVIFAANLPLAGVEGLISVFILSFLAKMLPDYVPRPAGI